MSFSGEEIHSVERLEVGERGASGVVEELPAVVTVEGTVGKGEGREEELRKILAKGCRGSTHN